MRTDKTCGAGHQPALGTLPQASLESIVRGIAKRHKRAKIDRSGFPNGSRANALAGHSVACIDDALGPVGQLMIIHLTMRGSDDDCIERSDCFLVPVDGFDACPMSMFTCGTNDRDIRIVISYLGAAAMK